MSGVPSAVRCSRRDEPSSAQRQVAYDTMKLHRALHTQAMSGETCSFAWPHLELVNKTPLSILAEQDKAARLQSIIEYSQEVASVLLAACSR